MGWRPNGPVLMSVDTDEVFVVYINHT